MKILDFDKYAYVSIDAELPAFGTLSDEEIVKKVGCDDQLNIATNSDEDEEIEEISKPTINPKEALDKINDLRIFFFLNNSDCSSFINNLISMENFLIDNAFTKQPTLNEFLSNKKN